MRKHILSAPYTTLCRCCNITRKEPTWTQLNDFTYTPNSQQSPKRRIYHIPQRNLWHPLKDPPAINPLPQPRAWTYPNTPIQNTTSTIDKNPGHSTRNSARTHTHTHTLTQTTKPAISSTHVMNEFHYSIPLFILYISETQNWKLDLNRDSTLKNPDSQPKNGPRAPTHNAVKLKTTIYMANQG